jgi:hypothetical protein
VHLHAAPDRDYTIEVFTLPPASTTLADSAFLVLQVSVVTNHSGDAQVDLFAQPDTILTATATTSARTVNGLLGGTSEFATAYTVPASL